MIKHFTYNKTYEMLKEQYETIKVLGITICKSLKQACFLRQQILQKMENHINKLTPRKL